MSTTTHTVALNFTSNVKQQNQQILQMKQHLAAVQKGGLRQQVLQQKGMVYQQKTGAAIAKQQKAAAPQQLTAFKQQNQQLKQQNQLLTVQVGLWTKIKNAAGAAVAKMRGGGGGGGRGRGGGGGGGGGKPVPGFGAGFNQAMGFGGPGPSRYGMGHGLGRGVRYGLGMAGSGLAALGIMPFQAVSSDYQAYFSYNRQLGGMAGLNKGARFGAGVTAGGLDASRDRMAELGYSPEDTINATRAFSRATGNSGDTERGMTAARTLGMDPTEIANMFADMRRAGGGFGEKGMREFQKVLMAAVKGGVDASTLPEYLEGVQHLTTRSAGTLGGAVSTAPYAQLLSFFQKSGMAGLQGARGASTLGTLEDMIRRPGGGEEGQAVMLSAMGFGSGKSFYEAKKAQELGLQGGAGQLGSIFKHVDQITGGGELANLYTQELTGGALSLSQIEEVRKAMAAGGTTEQIDEMLAEMTATELDVLKNIDENMRDFLGASKRSAQVQIKDIERGKKYADSMESIQDILHEWMDFMSGPVKSVLEGVNEAMHVLVPAVQDLVTFLKGEEERSFAMSASAEQAHEAYMNLRSGAEGTANAEMFNLMGSDPSQLSEDQLREIATESFQAQQALRAEYANPSFLQALSEMVQTPFAGMTGGTQADQAAAARQAELDRVIRALDLLADRLGRGDEIDPAQIHTEQQIIAAMQQIGITPPASFRATTSSTGGAP